MSLSAMFNGNHTRNGVLRRSCWDPGFPLLPTRSVCTFQRFQDWPQCSLSTWQMLVHLLLCSRASCAGLPLVCRISPAKIPKPADVSEPAKAQLQLHWPCPRGTRNQSSWLTSLHGAPQSLKKGELSDRFPSQWRISCPSSQNTAVLSCKWTWV